MATHRLLMIGALLALLLLTACQPIQAPAALTPTPNAEVPAVTMNEVMITATEYSFADVPENIPAGWTRVILDNQGELPHDIQFFRIEEGRTIDDVMAALQAEGPPEWAEFFGVATAQGGESNWFASNLLPGTYVYLSFGESEDGPPDAAQGMIGTLTVTESTEPVAESAPINEDVSIEMVDYQFVISGTIEAGEQVLRLSNTGTELHEAIFFKLHEGNTIEDFMSLLEQEMGGEPMPAEGATPEAGTTSETGEMPGEFAGNVLLSPGIVSYTTQEFEPGTYVIVCFIPSPEHEMQPHVALGMIQQVAVE